MNPLLFIGITHLEDGYYFTQLLSIGDKKQTFEELSTEYTYSKYPSHESDKTTLFTGIYDDNRGVNVWISVDEIV